MEPFDFYSDANEILLNPRMPEDRAERLRSWLAAAEGLRGHVFVLTSGSTATSEADSKWVALSKEAVLNSARAANEFLESDARDVWLHGLPGFHVGGMGIWARALLSGARVARLDPALGWNAEGYAEAIRQSGATLSSLVPAQVHDLVRLNLPSPPTIRAIVVGGGALAEGLYLGARRLGWPVLNSYGLSETASQIATASLASLRELPERMPRMELLPHANAGQAEDGRLTVWASSLFTGYVSAGPAFWDPKTPEGWLVTEDLGYMRDGALFIQGRHQERIKIGGEISNLGVLRRALDEQAGAAGLGPCMALVAVPDERLEHVIALVIEPEADASKIETVVAAFNERVLPFERIRMVKTIDRIPRTEIGKVKWGELSARAPSL